MSPLVRLFYPYPVVNTVVLVISLSIAPVARGISTRTLFTPTGAAAGDVLGISVAPAGEVNGDGFDDVIVGALWNDAGDLNAGRAYLYDSRRDFVFSPNDDEVWNVGTSQNISWPGAEPADLWLSADAGATWHLLQGEVRDAGCVALAPTRPFVRSVSAGVSHHLKVMVIRQENENP